MSNEESKQGGTEVASSFSKNLATYMAAASAAGVSLLALKQSAEAKVIYTPAYLSFNGNIYLDLNRDGIFDVGLEAYGFCESMEIGSLCGRSNRIHKSSYQLGKFLGPSGSTPALFAGQAISPTAQFNAEAVIASDWYRFFSGTSSPPKWFGAFANGGKGVRNRYIAFKFFVGSEPHFGWLRVSVQIKNPKERGYNAFVTGYAWETEANKGLVAGQTTGAEIMPADIGPNVRPPASLGMLARGAQALAIWRREEQ